MGLLENIFGKKKKELKNETIFKTLNAWNSTYYNWNGKAYENELVRSCIDAKARHISKLEIEFEGNSKAMMKRILKVRPNKYMTWSQFFYRLSTILENQNNAFIVPILDNYEQVIGLYPVLPSRCEIVEANGVEYVRYQFFNGGMKAMELERTGIMTKYQYNDDFFGEKTTAINNSIELDDLRKKAIKDAVNNSGSAKFFAQLTNFTTDEDLKKEQQAINENNYIGVGDTKVFPNTYSDIKQIQYNQTMLNKEQMEVIKSDVYGYYGVNEDILQNKAYGDSWSAFYEGAIEPFAIQFSEVVSGLLYTSQEQQRGNRIIATTNRLAYATTEEKLRVSTQMADRGIFTLNAICDIWGQPHVEGGDNSIIRGEYYLLKDKINGNEQEEDGKEEEDDGLDEE